MTCLTQTLSDNLIQAEIQAMLSNSEFVVFLNQSGIDRNILRQIYPEIQGRKCGLSQMQSRGPADQVRRQGCTF